MTFYKYLIGGEIQDMSDPLWIQCDESGSILNRLPFPIVTSLKKDEFRALSGDFKDIPDNLILAKIPTEATLKKLLPEGSRLIYQVYKTEEEARTDRASRMAEEKARDDRKEKILRGFYELSDEQLAALGINTK